MLAQTHKNRAREMAQGALPDKGGGWIHSTHVNVRQFWQAVHNRSTREAETGEALEQAI